MQRQPLLLERDGGARFALLHRPAGIARAGLLLLPPFAEELNKTRRALAQACARLCAAGFAVLQLDPLGCGDSAGDFADARWQVWLDDATQLGLPLLRELLQDRPVLGWGLRAGALLCSALDEQLDGQLWWQPSTQGRMVLQQFLRLRLAASLDKADRETMADLRQRLAAGETLEVAGYRLHPALADALEAAELRAPRARALWLEASSREPAALLPASQSLIAGWRSAGLQARALHDASPWAASELEDSPALTQASLDWLESWCAA